MRTILVASAFGLVMSMFAASALAAGEGEVCGSAGPPNCDAGLTCAINSIYPTPETGICMKDIAAPPTSPEVGDLDEDAADEGDEVIEVFIDDAPDEDRN